jgi:hypothetical protein
MSWLKRWVDWTVLAAEEAVRDKLQRTFEGVNETLETVNAATKPVPPQPSEPWPEWYASTVSLPTPPLDATARAVFAAREEERRRESDKRYEMMMRHMNDLHQIRMKGF